MTATKDFEESVDSASNPYLDTRLISSIQVGSLGCATREPFTMTRFAETEAKGLDESSISIPESSHALKPSSSTNTACTIAAMKASSSGYIDVDNEPITLDIGGRVFRTSMRTLKKHPGSLFASMFSGKYSLKPDANGAYFIDRDGTNFRYILNYLRTSRLIVPPNNKQLIAELLEECTFYQIAPLINILSIKQIDTAILQQKHIEKLNELIINRIFSGQTDEHHAGNGLQGYDWDLLYRFESDHHFSHESSNKFTKFSRNTLESSYVVVKDFVFLSKIAGYSPTLIVISADKYILGGFTTIKWPSHCAQWKKKTLLSNDSTHSTWDFLEFWRPNADTCGEEYRFTFVFKFDNECGEDEEEKGGASFFEYKRSERDDLGHPELHGTIKTHREDWNQSPLPYFRTQSHASDCFDKSKPHIDDQVHLYLSNVDGSVLVNNPWTKQMSYVRSWECFHLNHYQ